MVTLYYNHLMTVWQDQCTDNGIYAHPSSDTRQLGVLPAARASTTTEALIPAPPLPCA